MRGRTWAERIMVTVFVEGNLHVKMPAESNCIQVCTPLTTNLKGSNLGLSIFAAFLRPGKKGLLCMRMLADSDIKVSNKLMNSIFTFAQPLN